MVNKEQMNTIQNSDDISLIELWDVLWKSRVLIISLTAGISFFFLLYAIQATPIYRAEILIASNQPSDQGLSSSISGLNALTSLAGINIGAGDGDTQTALAILKSRQFIEEYTTVNNLMPILFEEQWSSKNNQWKKVKHPTLWDAYKKIKTDVLFVTEDLQTGLITVSIDWTDPIFAAEWANGMIQLVNARIRNQAISEAEKNISFLNQELKKTSIVNLQSVFFSLIEEQTKKAMLANVRDEYAFKIIDPAVIPQERESPRRTRIVVVGTIIGFIISLLLSMFRNAILKPSSQT